MIDDDRIEAILASVGSHLDVSSAAALPRRQWRRPLAIAAVALSVLAGAVTTVAPARRAVSGWLRIGRTEIHADTDLSTPIDELPSFVVAVPSISAGAAEQRLGTPLPDLAATTLGRPDAWLAPSEGGVVAVWRDGATSLWLRPATDETDELFRKVVTMVDHVTELPDLGDGGALVEGDHVLETPLRRVRAATTVLWTEGDLAYRLESSRPADELVAVAREIVEQS